MPRATGCGARPTASSWSGIARPSGTRCRPRTCGLTSWPSRRACGGRPAPRILGPGSAGWSRILYVGEFGQDEGWEWAEPIRTRLRFGFIDACERLATIAEQRRDRPRAVAFAPAPDRRIGTTRLSSTGRPRSQPSRTRRLSGSNDRSAERIGSTSTIVLERVVSYTYLTFWTIRGRCFGHSGGNLGKCVKWAYWEIQ
jgi:hypothetical protein